MVYHGLSLNIMGVHGLSCFFSWFIMGYHGLPKFILVYHVFPWFFMVYHGLSWFILFFHGLSCFIMVYPGLSPGLSWFTKVYRVFRGVSWLFAWFIMVFHTLSYCIIIYHIPNQITMVELYQISRHTHIIDWI